MKTRAIFVTMVIVCCFTLWTGSALAAKPTFPQMYPAYTLTGSWEEMGRQTAMYFPGTIMTTGFVFKNFIGIGADEALAYYEETQGLIPQGIKDQMRGIASGMNEFWSIPYDTAWQWALIGNMGFDIMNKHKLDEEAPGCTAFAFHSGLGTFLSHNTDNSASNMDMGSLIRYVPDNGENSFVSLFSPLFAGVSLAMNDKGLAVTYNVGGRNKNPLPGLSVLFKTRDVMATCDTLAQAVDSFTGFLEDGGTYGYSTANFLIVDFKDGSMARLQVCSDAIKVTYGQDLKPGVTFIAYTNEFDDDFSPRTAEDLQKTSVISSRARYARLMELLPQFDAYDLATCWAILTDSSGGEPTNNTICRRGDSTVTTIANIFTDDALYYTVGPPCEYLEMFDGPAAVSRSAPVVASVSGKVTALGKPVARARVVLEGAALGDMKLQTFTGDDGAFVFNNLITGTYRLSARKFFHFPRRMPVHFTEGEPQDLDIAMPF